MGFPDIGRSKETRPMTEAVRQYVRNTDEVRARTAKDYKTTATKVKKAYNRTLFGGSLAQWKRQEGVADTARSECAEAFEKEMKRARVLVAEAERNGRAGRVHPTKHWCLKLRGESKNS